jgi:hypothetical protein
MRFDPTAAMARDAAIHAALRDQIVAIMPPDARIVGAGWRPWASASFAGARHWFDLGAEHPLSADEARTFATELSAREWPLPRAFVADAALHSDEPAAGLLRAELLVVDD